jgi:hypothetical protein
VIRVLIAILAAGLAVAAYVVAGPGGLCWFLLAGVALFALAMRSRWNEPQREPQPVRTDAVAGPGRFAEYADLASRLSTSLTDQRYFDHSVRPRLARLASALAVARHGTADTLASRLGADAWRLLDPDRPPWQDAAGERHPGPTAAQLDALVDRIEAL